MTWTYSGDPTTSLADAVRFYVQDTNTSDQLLADEEIQFLIDQWYEKYNSAIFVAAVAAETIASKFAREVSVSTDGVSVGTQELQSKYTDLARQLRSQYRMEQLAGGAAESFGNNFGEEFDAGIKPLSFGVGLWDNREAGQQDYGANRLPPYTQEFNV